MAELHPTNMPMVLRQDLMAFIEKVFVFLNPGEKLLWNWHIEVICWDLLQVFCGRLQRLAICLPPRHGKSITVTVGFVAWLLGHRPAARVMCASYAQTLALEHSRATRRIMQSDWYKSVFPHAQLSPEKAAEDLFMTTAQGFRRAVSTGSAVMGHGGDILIGDDLMQPDDLRSEESRLNVTNWFRNVFITRLNQPKEGGIILVMQRLHEHDLIGHIAEEGGWTIRTIPAIAEATCRYQIGPDLYHVRKAGDLLHPERVGQAELNQAKIAMGHRAFSAQYQQNPVPAGGNLFKLDWFKRYDPATINPAQFALVFQSWDVASSVGDHAAFSVCTTWGMTTALDYYLLNVFRARLELPDVIARARFLNEREQPDAILVEVSGVGASLYQDLARDLGFRVIRTSPTGSKAIRAERLTAFLAQGTVYLPSQADWFEAFWRELVAFPAGRYDDQVDSFTQFIANRVTMVACALQAGPRRPLGQSIEGPSSVTVKFLAPQNPNFWQRNRTPLW